MCVLLPIRNAPHPAYARHLQSPPHMEGACVYVCMHVCLHTCLAAAQAEEVEKSCVKCGAQGTKHIKTLEVLRAPRVLVLHLKRFCLEAPSVEGGAYR